EKFFEEALQRGNAKAALQIGQMYMFDYSPNYPQKKRYKYMIAMYELAAKMGCPEAWQALAVCYDNGWGVRKSYKKAIELVKKGAELGSPLAMAQYGEALAYEFFQFEEGRKWLRRSMDLGNGDAAIPIARIYDFEENAEGIIQSLRAGAKLGSIDAIDHLSLTYLIGEYGQDKNVEYGNRLDELQKSLDPFYPPKPIPDYDQRFPPLPIKPWK
ncbi:MAG: hypothetical protein LBS65_03085, partial [Desulfovibrio sp.]|nr:hypothetical protein [Desulfovibrio sp.]